MGLPTPFGGILRPLLDHEVLLVVSVSTTLVMLGQGITALSFPMFARSFGVSTAAIGLTLSAFALARMLTNVPLRPRNGPTAYGPRGDWTR